VCSSDLEHTNAGIDFQHALEVIIDILENDLENVIFTATWSDGTKRHIKGGRHRALLFLILWGWNVKFPIIESRKICSIKNVAGSCNRLNSSRKSDPFEKASMKIENLFNKANEKDKKDGKDEAKVKMWSSMFKDEDAKKSYIHCRMYERCAEVLCCPDMKPFDFDPFPVAFFSRDKIDCEAERCYSPDVIYRIVDALCFSPNKNKAIKINSVDDINKAIWEYDVYLEVTKLFLVTAHEHFMNHKKIKSFDFPENSSTKESMFFSVFSRDGIQSFTWLSRPFLLNGIDSVFSIHGEDGDGEKILTIVGNKFVKNVRKCVDSVVNQITEEAYAPSEFDSSGDRTPKQMLSGYVGLNRFLFNGKKRGEHWTPEASAKFLEDLLGRASKSNQYVDAYVSHFPARFNSKDICIAYQGALTENVQDWLVEMKKNWLAEKKANRK
jgi:hypothetical protein